MSSCPSSCNKKITLNIPGVTYVGGGANSQLKAVNAVDRSCEFASAQVVRPTITEAELLESQLVPACS
jgi:hypothetical protein